jgi:Spy/CpxP family protein refolding chaperone
MRRAFPFTAILLFLASPGFAAAPASPYAGQSLCALKALSDAEIADYLSGKGMGLAKAAELNHYPGPRHVLDLSAELKLSADQKRRIEALQAKMLAEARDLGTRIVEKERELDALFATRKIKSERLRTLAAEIAGLQGELRYVHLNAHLALYPVLTPGQIRRYDGLRGYRAAPSGTEHEHSRRH